MSRTRLTFRPRVGEDIIPVSISAAGNVDLFSPTAFVSNLGSYTKSDTWPVTSSMQSDTGHTLCV